MAQSWEMVDGRRRYRIVAEISNTSVDLLFDVQQDLGFGHLDVERPRAENHKPLYCLEFEAGVVELLHEAIRPFLRLKGRQLDILLELRQTSQRGGRQVSDDVWNKRQQLVDELHGLNQRGR
jgi:hypothetical protein